MVLVVVLPPTVVVEVVVGDGGSPGRAGVQSNFGLSFVIVCSPNRSLTVRSAALVLEQDAR
jgi:hypothetical protein